MRAREYVNEAQKELQREKEDVQRYKQLAASEEARCLESEDKLRKLRNAVSVEDVANDYHLAKQMTARLETLQRSYPPAGPVPVVVQIRSYIQEARQLSPTHKSSFIEES